MTLTVHTHWMGERKKPSKTARAVALIYNWWSWCVRAANPQARREALTSRPLLLAAVGRAATSTAGFDLDQGRRHRRCLQFARLDRPAALRPDP